MSDADYIGQQFGSYKIIEFISGGTYGSVFKARHVHFENDPNVAIKILHSHISSQEERAQFITEAQLLRKLKHPHILPVMDVNIQNGIPYMITEYAVGGTLRNRIKKQASQPFPIDESVKIITQVGEALHYAHQQEPHVVHCDLKPENILFNAKGDALLADFGIAAILETTGTKMLGSGGTPGYMAPEQFKGAVSPKIDQYALGCIAYELFAGRHPYNLQGANAHAAEHQHAQVEPVDPSTYNLQLPAHIETAIKTAMAKDRNNRYSDVEAFLAALQKTAFSQSQPTTKPVISQPSTVPVTPPPPVGKYTNILSQTSPNSIEQLFQEGVRAQTNGNQDEIRLWEDLLALEPSAWDIASLPTLPLTLGKKKGDIMQSIQVRLQIAQQNEQYAWMYAGAQQFIQNRDIASASTQLQTLWREAPYYGDSANLAQIVGLPAALNYEQAIAVAKRKSDKYNVIFSGVTVGLGLAVAVTGLGVVVLGLFVELGVLVAGSGGVGSLFVGGVLIAGLGGLLVVLGGVESKKVGKKS